MSRIPIKLARQFRTLRGHCESDDAVYGVELVDDCIDQWEVVFRYPEHSTSAIIKLRFLFSLTEELPPKVTVLEPKSVPYVCYAELGSASWSSDSDIVTLTLCLREELYLRHSSDLSSGNTERFTPEESEEKWKFVKDAHGDWNMPDITELNTQVAVDTLEEARKEARREYLLSQEQTSPSNQEDVTEPRDPRLENDQQEEEEGIKGQLEEEINESKVEDIFHQPEEETNETTVVEIAHIQEENVAEIFRVQGEMVEETDEKKVEEIIRILEENAEEIFRVQEEVVETNETKVEDINDQRSGYTRGSMFEWVLRFKSGFKLFGSQSRRPSHSTPSLLDAMPRKFDGPSQVSARV